MELALVFAALLMIIGSTSAIAIFIMLAFVLPDLLDDRVVEVWLCRILSVIIPFILIDLCWIMANKVVDTAATKQTPIVEQEGSHL